MLYFLILIICMLCFIIIALFNNNFKYKSKLAEFKQFEIDNINYKEELDKQKQNIKKIQEEKQLYYNEIQQLKKQFEILEKNEIKTLIDNTIEICNQKIPYQDTFKGKKAIIGNYCEFMAKDTRKMLRAFGLSVEIVSTGVDLYEKVLNGNHYDIIFTNNIYQQGFNGPELLLKLRQIPGFNTPVVVHTISENQRERFINNIGFDEYIQKPIKIDEIERVLNKFLKD